MTPTALERLEHRSLLLGEGAGPRTCRVCGCTDDDCEECLALTGRPCWWVAEDLCSACVRAQALARYLAVPDRSIVLPAPKVKLGQHVEARHSRLRPPRDEPGTVTNIECTLLPASDGECCWWQYQVLLDRINPNRGRELLVWVTDDAIRPAGGGA